MHILTLISGSKALISERESKLSNAQVDFPHPCMISNASMKQSAFIKCKYIIFEEKIYVEDHTFNMIIFHIFWGLIYKMGCIDNKF